MRTGRTLWVVPLLLLVVVALAVVLATDGQIESAALADEGKPAASAASVTAADTIAAPVPVENDMHEFMEYIFEPTYKRLSVSMGAEPVDNRGWKEIKGDALVLAEAGNLLLLRRPEDPTKEDLAHWQKHSAAVRGEGAALYQAAKKKDFAVARTRYAAMLTNCNACHNKFADGEHQLKP